MQYEVETEDAIYEVEASSDEEARAKVKARLAIDTAPEVQAVAPKSNLEGFLEHNQLTAPFAHPGQLIKDTANALAPAQLSQDIYPEGVPRSLPEALGFNLPFKILGQVGKEMLQGSSDSSQRAFEKAWMDNEQLQGKSFVDSIEPQVKGTYHNAIGLLGAFPLTQGLATAALDLEEGRGGSTGEVLGELSNIALPFLPKAIKGASNKLAGSLEKGAVNKYVSALNPKQKFQGLAEASARQSLERGEFGTLGNLARKAEKDKAKFGSELEQIYAESPATLDVGKATSPTLDQLANKQLYGDVQFNQPLETAARDLQANLQQAGELPVGEAWRLRQTLEQPAVKKGAYLPGTDPTLVAKAEASQAAADALRPALAEAEPKSVQPNKQYNYYSNLQTLLKNRKSPNSPISLKGATNLLRRQGVAGTVGGAIAGPGGAALAGIATEVLNAISNTTLWKTGSAVVQYKIAQALKAGKVADALAIYKSSGGDPSELQLPGDLEFKLSQIQDPDLSIIQDPQLAPTGEPRLTNAPNIFGGDEVPEGFRGQPELPVQEPGLELPLAQEPDLGAFQEPQESLGLTLDESMQQAGAPRVFEGETPAGFELPEVKTSQLEALAAELEHSGFQPSAINANGLTGQQIAIIEAADARATQAALRTINNPTYQKLPVQAVSGKTRASVLREIFQRHRQQAARAIQDLDRQRGSGVPIL